MPKSRFSKRQAVHSQFLVRLKQDLKTALIIMQANVMMAQNDSKRINASMIQFALYVNRVSHSGVT